MITCESHDEIVTFEHTKLTIISTNMNLIKQNSAKL